MSVNDIALIIGTCFLIGVIMLAILDSRKRLKAFEKKVNPKP